jgi:hypothetical protein
MRRVGGQLNAETDGAVEVCEKKWCMAKTNVLLSWLCIQAFSSASTSCPRSAKGLYEETLGEHSKQPLQGDGSSLFLKTVAQRLHLPQPISIVVAHSLPSWLVFCWSPLFFFSRPKLCFLPNALCHVPAVF